MEWAKISCSFLLHGDLTPSEKGIISMIKALTVQLKREPTEGEILKLNGVGRKALAALTESLRISNGTLSEHVRESLGDLSESNRKRIADRERKHLSRSKTENVTRDGAVTLIREEENREEENRKDNIKMNILTDIPKKPPQENLISEVVGKWNEFSFKTNLAQVRDLTPKRTAGIKARLSEKNFDLENLFREISSSEFLLGDNKDGWKVTFDFVFLSPHNWLKIVEGNYRKNQKKIKTMEDLFNELK